MKPSYDEAVKIYNSVVGRLAAEALKELSVESGVNFPPISLEHSDLTPTKVSFCDSNGKEFARINFKLKRIVSKSHKLEKYFDWEWVTLTKAKGMGFSESQLEELFGEPILVENPHFATSPPMQLYPKHWLDKIPKPPMIEQLALF